MEARKLHMLLVPGGSEPPPPERPLRLSGVPREFWGQSCNVCERPVYREGYFTGWGLVHIQCEPQVPEDA